MPAAAELAPQTASGCAPKSRLTHSNFRAIAAPLHGRARLELHDVWVVVVGVGRRMVCRRPVHAKVLGQDDEQRKVGDGQQHEAGRCGVCGVLAEICGRQADGGVD